MHIIDGIAYLTVAEAADRLWLSVGTLNNQRTERRSPMRYVKQLGRVLYPRSEVEAYARTLGRPLAPAGGAPETPNGVGV
ncbi:helix-turn-helix domain-containing protein [Dactylosporangium sucinum]|uniref:Helix-turn-helix domain-containing protein n=1 Tax=Dactylosporangium sucinum TaxID=1424081 RepID=A0A917X8M7_9ACTN|nr:helix-turn-helix domain-containing protein [Dactylosporangium sucinum]GGM90249.1 hypothetical protein GCM10007977_110370 [Dactylosporangium sucinum]